MNKLPWESTVRHRFWSWMPIAQVGRQDSARLCESRVWESTVFAVPISWAHCPRLGVWSTKGGIVFLVCVMPVMYCPRGVFNRRLAWYGSCRLWMVALIYHHHPSHQRNAGSPVRTFFLHFFKRSNLVDGNCPKLPFGARGSNKCARRHVLYTYWRNRCCECISQIRPI